MSRESWLGGSDDKLLADCEVDRYRASGPGGQKRNKTESAIRLRHQPSGVVVCAADTRSQHKNRRLALSKLRTALAIEVREPGCEIADEDIALIEAMVKRGRVTELRHVAQLLDLLADAEMSLRVVGERLGVTTAAVAKTLRSHLGARRWVNQERARRELGPLR